jgi:hypothetical protein
MATKYFVISQEDGLISKFLPEANKVLKEVVEFYREVTGNSIEAPHLKIYIGPKDMHPGLTSFRRAVGLSETIGVFSPSFPNDIFIKLQPIFLLDGDDVKKTRCLEDVIAHEFYHYATHSIRPLGNESRYRFLIDEASAKFFENAFTSRFLPESTRNNLIMSEMISGAFHGLPTYLKMRNLLRQKGDYNGYKIRAEKHSSNALVAGLFVSNNFDVPGTIRQLLRIESGEMPRLHNIVQNQTKSESNIKSIGVEYAKAIAKSVIPGAITGGVLYEILTSWSSNSYLFNIPFSIVVGLNTMFFLGGAFGNDVFKKIS